MDGFQLAVTKAVEALGHVARPAGYFSNSHLVEVYVPDVLDWAARYEVLTALAKVEDAHAPSQVVPLFREA